MFIRKSKHAAIVADLQEEADYWCDQTTDLDAKLAEVKAELSALKIEANRRLAPLMAANAARKEAAAAKRKAKGGEG